MYTPVAADTELFPNRSSKETACTGGKAELVNPPALVAMPDGTLVLLYGFRDAPFGLRAVVSCDNGQTWSGPLVLRDDGGDADLGYPRALVRQDGKIVVVYYFNDRNGPERFIAASVVDIPI